VETDRDMARRMIVELLESEALSPHEIEKVAPRCIKHVRIDAKAVRREIFLERKWDLLQEIVEAGASNQLVRTTYGVPLRDITRLRQRTGTCNPGRPRRMSLHERQALDEYIAENPVPPIRSQMAEWCLYAHRQTLIPFMTIHRRIDGPSAMEAVE